MLSLTAVTANGLGHEHNCLIDLTVETTVVSHVYTCDCWSDSLGLHVCKCPCVWCVCVCVCRRLAWQPPPSVYECMNYCWSLWTKASSNCPKCKSKESHCILSHVKESHFVLQHIKQSRCVLTSR